MKLYSAAIALAGGLLFPAGALAFSTPRVLGSNIRAVDATTMPWRTPNKTALRMSDDQPSDTSSDSFDSDVVEVLSESFTPSESETTITNLLDLVPSTLSEISESKRAMINEVILKLEALNPTPNPARSPLMNGVWELRYAAGYSSDGALPSPTRQLALFLYSGGYSPGLFVLNLAKQVIPSSLIELDGLEISISREQPRVQASVQVKTFGQSSVQKVQIKATLQAESGIRLRETYESTSILSETFMEIPEPLKYSRELCK
jgi:PAP_fibrillin